jgi:hypothetical protein
LSPEGIAVEISRIAQRDTRDIVLPARG